jgi:hypothetical protein
VRNLLQVLSFLALAGIIVPPVLYLAGSLGKPPMQAFMLWSTVLWFATVPFWMGRREGEA